ncbi:MULTISPECIES: hypothetical protein [unclassified Rathayibacter]|uniref:hypothetical protein n=2 Tax=Rathayibacter TaxID=33886 RepID=UPI000CE792E4|nr:MULTISPECIES: hypothetical protein [unclassified Rathayibacter]PPF14307.1 hypothetical protein C5B92_15230 [Rathayibacter sp. AY1A4]PPG79902.1 hypothetical protein C5C52_11345 [Rathayibacter sp. AY1E5]PPH31651.1 hypothetical protein C5C94_07940 [Rathayibacter sp. AY1C3]PPI29349.1 hypothetical protein C5D66_11345 [Rathayibacter sp. AY1B4]
MYREREEKLETDCVAATDREGALLAELEEEILKLRAASEEQAAAARLDAARAIEGRDASVSVDAGRSRGRWSTSRASLLR